MVETKLNLGEKNMTFKITRCNIQGLYKLNIKCKYRTYSLVVVN